MPNIKSAMKRVKVAEKKTLNNNMLRSQYRTAVKKYEIANANGDANAPELLKEAKRMLDHACSKGVITKNAAARKKSRLERKLAVKEAAKKKVAKKEEPAKETKVVKAEKEVAPKKTTTKKATATKKSSEEAPKTAKKASTKKEEE